MATISGYNSYSMGVLFSGLNTTSSKKEVIYLESITVTGQQSDRAAILNC